MSIFSVIFILCFLGLHACNARPHPLAVVENVNLGYDSVQIKPETSSKTEEQHGLKKEDEEKSGIVDEGSGIVKTYSTHMGFARTRKTQGKENYKGGVNEGFMENDYNPPHRRSPIHN